MDSNLSIDDKLLACLYIALNKSEAGENWIEVFPLFDYLEFTKNPGERYTVLNRMVASELIFMESGNRSEYGITHNGKERVENNPLILEFAQNFQKEIE